MFKYVISLGTDKEIPLEAIELVAGEINKRLEDVNSIELFSNNAPFIDDVEYVFNRVTALNPVKHNSEYKSRFKFISNTEYGCDVIAEILNVFAVYSLNNAIRPEDLRCYYFKDDQYITESCLTVC